MYVCVRMCVCVFVCVCVCLCMCVFICMYSYMYEYMCSYICSYMPRARGHLRQPCVNSNHSVARILSCMYERNWCLLVLIQ